VWGVVNLYGWTVRGNFHFNLFYNNSGVGKGLQEDEWLLLQPSVNANSTPFTHSGNLEKKATEGDKEKKAREGIEKENVLKALQKELEKTGKESGFTVIRRIKKNNCLSIKSEKNFSEELRKTARTIKKPTANDPVFPSAL
jgi:hypothetical protein